MKEIVITEEDLEYFTHIPMIACEKKAYYNSKIHFEEAVKACNGITLEEFSRNIDEAIRRLIPNP